MHNRNSVEILVDRTTYDEAAAVLEADGLTVSDAVHHLLRRTAQDGTLPFKPLAAREAPNATMREAASGPTYTLEELLVNMTPDTFHEPLDFGGPVGKETW